MTRSENTENSDSSNLSKSHETNPFIAFRRFADEQVATLFNTVLSLPSALLESQSERRRLSWKDDTGHERHTEDEREEQEREDQSLLDLIKKLEDASDKMRQSVEKEIFGDGSMSSLFWGSSRPYADWHKLDQEQGSGGLSTSQQAESDSSKDINQDVTENQDTTWFQEWPGLSSYRGPSCRMGHRHGWHRSEEQEQEEAGARQLPEDSIADRLEESQALFIIDAMRPFSPFYSPFRVEKNPKLGAMMSWRDAYEDLLRAASDQPLIEQPNLGKHDEQRPLRWARGVRHRLRSMEGTTATTTAESRPFPVKDAFEESGDIHKESSSKAATVYSNPVEGMSQQQDGPSTEQDMYEQLWRIPALALEEATSRMNNIELESAHETDFLNSSKMQAMIGQSHDADGQKEAIEYSHGVSDQQLFDTEQSKKQSAPQARLISSQLKTTYRILQPDGRILTKTVQRTTHADGREESSTVSYFGDESPITESASPSILQSIPKFARKTEDSELRGESNGNQKKGGWFWSN